MAMFAVAVHYIATSSSFGFRPELVAFEGNPLAIATTLASLSAAMFTLCAGNLAPAQVIEDGQEVFLRVSR
jgi:hypothetical protein